MSQQIESQNKMILAYLQGGGLLTSLEALNLFGCLRLSARIHNLIGAGHRITGEMIELESGKRVKQYRYENTI
jgi:hypothetical protein